jgi:hypothetical protein
VRKILLATVNQGRLPFKTSPSFKIEFKDKRVMLCTVRPVVPAVLRSWVAAAGSIAVFKRQRLAPPA